MLKNPLVAFFVALALVSSFWAQKAEAPPSATQTKSAATNTKPTEAVPPQAATAPAKSQSAATPTPPPPKASTSTPTPAASPSQAVSKPATSAQNDAKLSADESLLRIKALEQRVNELKEQVFRSKARLNLLKETVLHGVIAGSRLVIKHRNDLGGSFRMVKIVYALDGTEIFGKADDEGYLDKNRDVDVFTGNLTPGDHTVSVEIQLKGHGYGVFSYLEGYEFNLRSSHAFTATEGRQLVLTIRAFEKGDFTTELKDRPAIKFETSIFKIGQEDMPILEDEKPKQ